MFCFCFRYLTPPNSKKWNKKNISALSTDQLANFPLQTFLDEYQRDLTSMMSKTNNENMALKKQLFHLRPLIASLLAHIVKRDPKNDWTQAFAHAKANPESTEIDELLESFVDKFNKK